MRVRVVAVLIAWFALLGASALRAQSADQPVSPGQGVTVLEESEAQVWKHRLGPSTAIHVNAAEERTLGFEKYLTFELVVSADGRVESAKPVGEEKRRLEEGRAIEMAPVQTVDEGWRQDSREGNGLRVVAAAGAMGVACGEFSGTLGPARREDRAFAHGVLREMPGVCGDDPGRWKRPFHCGPVCGEPWQA